MSGQAWVLVIAVFVWHVAVTVVLLAVIRQVSIIAESIGMARRRGSERVLAVGQPIPEALDSYLNAPADAKEGVRYVAWFSSDSARCRDVAQEMAGLRSHHEFADPILALVTGPENGTQEMVDLVAPLVEAVVVDPVASEIVSGLHLDSSPFVVQIEGGEVGGWADVGAEVDNFRQLYAAKRNSAISGEAS